MNILTKHKTRKNNTRTLEKKSFNKKTKVAQKSFIIYIIKEQNRKNNKKPKINPKKQKNRYHP